jgi:hypothetical protein
VAFFAFTALLAFPIVVLILFRKLPLQSALVWSIIAGYLLLPSEQHIYINLPIIPTIDKDLVPALSAAIIGYLLWKNSLGAAPYRARAEAAGIPRQQAVVLPGWMPRSFVGLALLGLLVFGAIMSVLTNDDVLVYGDRVLQAQRPYDALSVILNLSVVLLPALLGRKFLADNVGHLALMKAVCIAALAYVPLMLFEIRMSPQINQMVYGFFPHSWVQHIRGGGFRPLVFLDHGLHLGIFLAFTCVGVAILVRVSEAAARLRYIVALIVLLLALAISRNVGALLIGMVLVPVALLAPVRLQLFVAAAIAVLVLSYPILRGADLIPTDRILEIASSYSEERSRSLGARFTNEDRLLAHALERPLFGWSTWGRWRVYDETGQDITISDGAWVIAIAVGGWAGYIGQFGILCLPLILFVFRRKRYSISLVTSGLCLMIGANLIDLIPNAGSSPVFWMAAGAILGRIELPRVVTAAAGDSGDAPEPPPERARFGHAPPDRATGPSNVPERPAAVSRHTRFAHQARK